MSISDKLTGLLVGGAIGATIGYLTAPRSGQKTRAILNEKGKEKLEIVRDRYQEKRNQAEEMFNDANQQLAGRAEKLKNVGKKVMDRERDVLKEGIEEAQQAIST